MKKTNKILFIMVLMFMFIPRINAVTVTVDSTKQGTTDTNSYLVTNTGQLMINTVPADDTFKAYKIIDCYYNSSTDDIVYEFTSDFKQFLNSSSEYSSLTVEQYKNLTSGDVVNHSTQTTSTLDKLVSKYTTYIASHTSVNSINMTTSDHNDPYTREEATANVPVGAYLVLPESTANVYAVMVGNIDLVKESGAWTVNNQIINAKVSGAAITKIIKGKEVNKPSVNIGEQFVYKLDYIVPKFPTNATTKEAIITDIMTGGNEFLGFDNLKVYADSTELSLSSSPELNSDEETRYGILKNSEKVGEVSFTSSNELIASFDFSKFSAEDVIIEYNAKLNNDSLIGEYGNASFVSVGTNAPYDANSGITTSAPVAFNVYTYGIRMFSHDSSNNGVSGGTFKVYSDENLQNEIGEIVIGNDGYGTLDGVSTGTYYLKEETAPGGYSFNNDVFDVNVTDSNDYTEVSFLNEVTGLLPVTGGPGTIAMIAGGLLIIVGAVVAYFKFFAKKKEKNVG